MREMLLRIWDDYDVASGRVPRREAQGRPHTISLDGWEVELDLCDESVESLREVMEPWLNAGRGRKPPGRKPGSRRYDRGELNIFSQDHPLAHVRPALKEWCKERGYPISKRGYVTIGLQQKFFEEHPELANSTAGDGDSDGA